MLQQSSTVAGHQRKAGDSLDFHVRYGRAVHARAAREGLETLLTLFRSLRRRRGVTRLVWDGA